MATFRGAIFDVDGVLVDSPHEKAWRESLRQLMESDWSDIRDRTTWTPEAFTSRVYGEQMSGKPRMSGARAAAEAMAARRRDPIRVWSLQEIHAREKTLA